MALPQFTAEAALRTSSTRYRSASSHRAATGIIPQARANISTGPGGLGFPFQICWPFYWCDCSASGQCFCRVWWYCIYF
ncbi:MAG TPA: hypothetical protein VM008_13280 [Phycisphaerae bacterium]|nr:hypothetical protein [Phycisphaerae bacterium]